MGVDCEAPMFSKELEIIYNSSGIPFKKCVISIEDLVDENGVFVPTQDEFFSLDFLNELRLPIKKRKEEEEEEQEEVVHNLRDFLPDSIYIREEMRPVFAKFAGEYKEVEISRILVGSPGVGKSVLFLLAALARDEERFVIYFRKVPREISAFVMEAGESEGEVHVLVSRNMDRRQFSDLNAVSLQITEPTELPEEDFFFMLDGPHHNSPKEDLLCNAYNALCTGGGFPVPAQEQLLQVTIHLLSGWTEAAILSALAKLNISQTVAEEVYALCGGRIRLVVMAINNRRSEVKQWFNSLVTDLGANAAELAKKQKESAGVIESSDRMRTRFLKDDGTNIMVVDSHYLMRQLKERLQPEAFIHAYNLAHDCKLNSARGWFYEEILHRWFQGKAGNRHTAPKITGFFRKEDITGAASVKELVDLCVRGEGEGTYWVPSVPNFANIDATIQLGSVFNCAQDTVKRTHFFDKETFWTSFLGKLAEAGVVITNVNVWFVTPPDIAFQNTHEDYTQQYALPPTRASAKTSEAAKSVQVSFHVHHVDASSAAALDTSASAIPFLAD